MGAIINVGSGELCAPGNCADASERDSGFLSSSWPEALGTNPISIMVERVAIAIIA